MRGKGPGRSSGNLVICVMGESPLGSLKGVFGRSGFASSGKLSDGGSSPSLLGVSCQVADTLPPPFGLRAVRDSVPRGNMHGPATFVSGTRSSGRCMERN